MRTLNTDIVEMDNLRQGKPSALGEFPVEIDQRFFLLNTFGMGNVNTKTFILMLAQENPLSFISGAPVDLAKTLKESNRTEFHHLMPREFLKASKQNDLNDSLLANFCFMSRSDNRELGGVAPSVYRAKMAKNVEEILGHALCPLSLFEDKYATFLNDRSRLLAERAAGLCELKKAPPAAMAQASPSQVNM